MLERKARSFKSQFVATLDRLQKASLFLFDQILTKQNKTDPNVKKIRKKREMKVAKNDI